MPVLTLSFSIIHLKNVSGSVGQTLVFSELAPKNFVFAELVLRALSSKTGNSYLVANPNLPW